MNKESYNDRSGRLQFSIRICLSKETWRPTQRDCGLIRTAQCSGKSRDKFRTLTGGKECWWIGCHNVIPVEIDKQSLLSDRRGCGDTSPGAWKRPRHSAVAPRIYGPGSLTTLAMFLKWTTGT